MKQKYVFLPTCIFTVILLLASCQSESEHIASTDIVTDIAISQPTLELAMTLPPLSIPTEMAKTTSTSSPSPTVLVTIDSETMTLPPPLVTPTTLAATSTPLPTLEGNELDIAIVELLEYPMNCDSPCWWGAVPGVTTVNDIKHTLSPYSFDIHEYYDEDEQVHLRIRIEPIEEQDDNEINIAYAFSDTILKSVTVYHSQSISDILTKYGQPDEVYIETGITFDPIYFRLNLIYLQKGMGVGYVIESIQKDNKIEGCFAAELGVVQLRQQDSVTNYRDFRPIFGADRQYLTLEEATDLTMEEFMMQFTDPFQPHCIETLTELWE